MGRDSTHIEIYGMQGIPPDILATYYTEKEEEVASKVAKVDTPFTQLVGEVSGQLGEGYPQSTLGAMQPISTLPVPPAGWPRLASTTSPAHQPSPRQKFEHIKRLLESLNPSIRLHREKIEEHFSKLTHIPDHPPYASMIQRAITELNEQGGSSEETISKFIEAEYEDLPIAHAAQLTCHLQKLVVKGEIVSTSTNCYMLPYENIDFLHKLKKENKYSKRCGKNRKNSRQHKFKGVQTQKQQKFEDSQEQNQLQQEIFARIEEKKHAEQQIGPVGNQKKQERVELIGEQNGGEESRLKVVEEQIEAEQDREGNGERDQMQERQNLQQKELELQQSLALSETIDVTIEENYQAEGSNQAEKNRVTEAERPSEQDYEVTKEQNEVEELHSKVVEQIESEQDRERNEEHDKMEEGQNQQQKELNLQQSQILCETVDLTVEENYQEESNQAEKNSEVSEAEHQKEQEDEVIEELYHKELESKKHEEENQTTNPQSGVGDEQAQLPDIQLEEMVKQIDPERRHFEGSEVEKKLQEQKMEVCSQIFDLSNMLLRLIKKEKEVKATVSIQNNVTGQKVDLSDLSHLKKGEFMELLKKTNKVVGKLIDIICYLNLEVSGNNNSTPKFGGEQELVEEHLLQTENHCTGSKSVLACGFQPEQQQQLDICGQVKVAAYQAKIISQSVNLPTDSMQFVGNLQIELPTQKGLPAVETTLEDLFEKPIKQIKVCNQQEAANSQPRLMKLDVPCDSPQEENGNAQLAIQRMETVLEDNSETTEPNIKFSGERVISRLETEKSYINICIDSDQLKNSELCGLEKLPESQLFTSSLSVPIELQEHDLEYQQQTTFNSKEKRSGNKQPKNPFEGRHGEHEMMLVEHLSQTQQQMVGHGQQTQLQPFSQLDTAISVSKQLDQAKRMQKTQLRPRGGRSTEPLCPLLEADHDLTLFLLKSEQKKTSQHSILKRPQEQQRNHPHQKKRLKSQPTEITIDSAITSPLQAKGGLQQRQLWQQGGCSSWSDSVIKKRGEPFPFQDQQRGQEQLQPRQGRPPKLKSDVDTAIWELLADHQNHNDKQPQHCRVGRPPNSKSAAIKE